MKKTQIKRKKNEYILKSNREIQRREVCYKTPNS